MHALGIVLLLAAIASALFGASEWRARRRVLTTPFRRTGDVARRRFGITDARGHVGCEGIVQRCAPAIAPCSGRPCLYYEVEVLRIRPDGEARLGLVRGGEVFHLDDGSGPIAVDPRAGMDVELATTHTETIGLAYGHLQIGLLEAQIPPDDLARGVRVVERIVPMEGRLYVAGALDAERVIGGALLASRHGRAPLVAKAKNRVLAGIAGACLFFPAVALLAPTPSGACAIVDESREVCAGRIHDDRGARATLTVTRPGTFTVSADSPRAWIAIDDASAFPLVQNAPGGATIDLPAGTYAIRVNDSTPGHARMTPGGFSYQLVVSRRGPANAAIAMR